MSGRCEFAAAFEAQHLHGAELFIGHSESKLYAESINYTPILFSLGLFLATALPGVKL
jgi:hypothetical protein